jgi:large subunit ribosomal protein L4
VFVGGGVVHGPVTHSFTMSFPRKMKIAALKSALSSKADSVAVVDGMTTIDGKTKSVQKLIDVIAADKRKPMIVLADGMDNALMGLRNVKSVDYIHAIDLTTYDVVNHDSLIFTKEALDVLEKRVSK